MPPRTRKTPTGDADPAVEKVEQALAATDTLTTTNCNKEIEEPVGEGEPEEQEEEIPSVRLARPEVHPTQDQNLWTLIRNRTNAISFNRYNDVVNDVLCPSGPGPGKLDSIPDPGNLTFLGLEGYEVLRTITQLFLMQEVGLIVYDPYHGKTSAKQQQIYDKFFKESKDDSEFRRRSYRPLSRTWLTDMRKKYLRELSGMADPKVLPYLGQIMDKLADLPLKPPPELGTVRANGQDHEPEYCYGVLPSRLVGPLGLELIWSYWHEEGMLVQAHNAVTNRFQNLRTGPGDVDPLARLEIDPLRRLNNVLWGWIQNQPFLLSVRRRSLEYQHQYGVSLLGRAAGEVEGADNRSQFISAFHNLLHLCTIFYQQDDDLTVQADGFPLLNALRETQLVVTAGAHNQYGDLPWTSRVEMLMQMWMFARPEMREFLGGRIMVPYKEPWMDRVDTIKSAMGWTDVNVTHFSDLGRFGEQIMLSVRYGSWATEIEPDAAVNWARYWRPEIQGYVHAYRAATGADLRSTVDTTMPGVLLENRLPQRIEATAQRAIGRAAGVTAVTVHARSEHA